MEAVVSGSPKPSMCIATYMSQSLYIDYPTTVAHVYLPSRFIVAPGHHTTYNTDVRRLVEN